MRADIFRRGLLVGICAILAGCGASTMVTGLRQGLHFFVVNERLHLRGKVTGRTPVAFGDVLAQNPQVTTLVLQDLSGEHNSGAVQAIAYEVRKQGLNTALQSDSAVYGPAIGLFLAGVERSMVAGAEIGLRNEGFGNQGGALVKDMLGSEAFYDFALQRGPAGGIYIMTEDEILHFGLLTAPVEQVN